MDAAEAEDMQAWLEETYEAVDYEEALQRAGCLSESEPDQSEAQEEDFIADESAMYMEEDSICEGKERELTYGEMDLAFFVALLRKMRTRVKTDGNFFDVGCGRGQLVLAAAKTGFFKKCEGIEIMKDVLEIGRGAILVLEGGGMPSSECVLHEGDMYTSMELCKDSDLIFVYATCFATTDGVTIKKLSNALAAHTKPDARIITVNKKLSEDDNFVLEETYMGPNPDSATNPAIAYVWRKQSP